MMKNRSRMRKEIRRKVPWSWLMRLFKVKCRTIDSSDQNKLLNQSYYLGFSAGTSSSASTFFTLVFDFYFLPFFLSSFFSSFFSSFESSFSLLLTSFSSVFETTSQTVSEASGVSTSVSVLLAEFLNILCFKGRGLTMVNLYSGFLSFMLSISLRSSGSSSPVMAMTQCLFVNASDSKSTYFDSLFFSCLRGGFSPRLWEVLYPFKIPSLS